MLGPAKPRRLSEPIAVSLEELSPASHVYRHLVAKLDLSFVRDLVRDAYAPSGRPSSDPVDFCKRQRVLCCAGIRSERKLLATTSLHRAPRWDLGDARAADLPDPSRLTRVRQRFGLALGERCCARIGDRCQEAGLGWGAALCVEAPKVRADAAVDARVPRCSPTPMPPRRGPAPAQPWGTTSPTWWMGQGAHDSRRAGDTSGRDGERPPAGSALARLLPTQTPYMDMQRARAVPLAACMSVHESMAGWQPGSPAEWRRGTTTGLEEGS